MPNVGDKVRQKSTGRILQYDGRGWKVIGTAPAGTTARPEYGVNAYQTNQGDIVTTDLKGQPKILKQGGQQAEANLKGRVAIGGGVMMDAQQKLQNIERRGNPYALDKNPDNAAAKVLSNIGIDVGPIQMHPFEGIAKFVGGQDFQDYDRAASQFEAQLMPIMSGAAVNPSEARRQIRAALPELGDSPASLADKARVRGMMLNGMAEATGKPLPYPDLPSWDANAGGPRQSGMAQKPVSSDPLGIRRR